MGPEPGLVLPALGAAASLGLRARHRVAVWLGAALLGASTLALVFASAQPSPLGLTLAPPARALLVATAAALALMVALAPVGDRARLLGGGLLALAGLGVCAAVPDPVAMAAMLVLLGAAHAAVPGELPFADRMRGPAFAAILVGAGSLLIHAGGDPLLGRLAGLAFVLGLVAAAGLVPFLPALAPGDPPPASAVAWTAFFGPALAFAVVTRVQPQLPPAAVAAYGSLLVGLGLLNLIWGSIGAWRTEATAAAWRYSFLADWGLALVGLGIVVPDGQAAAYLVLLAVLLVRLPLYLAASADAAAPLRPTNLLIGCALAGAAPFAGFAPRVLLLRGAIGVFWPLALVLGIAMLLWLAHSFRLARTLTAPRGRRAVAVVVALAVSLVIGVAPALLLAGART